MNKTVAAVCCSIIALTACGDSNAKSSGSAAFCNNVSTLGSLTKGTADAMAMQPADAKKDFQVLATKITALKVGAPADLVATIDTVAARFTLEATAESMMATDPKGGTEETRMLADHKTADDAAIAKLIAAANSNCKINIS